LFKVEICGKDSQKRRDFTQKGRKVFKKGENRIGAIEAIGCYRML
jgi:hypothetical protein